MRTLFVRAVMSSPVITVSPSTPLPQVNSLMREQHIRRLPVVEHDRLVGLITFGNVRGALPSDAISLSVYELAYLMARVRCAEVMRKDVITISAGASIIQAAQLLLDHRISSLPVIDQGQLVGMITESNIFRAITSGLIAAVATPDTSAAARSRRSRSRL